MNTHLNISNILRLMCIIFTSLLAITSNACSLINSENQNGLRMLRDFTQIPTEIPVTIDQAKISLESKLPLESSKEEVLDYIDTKKQENTYCYWNTDESEMHCRIIYDTKKIQSYAVTFVFGNNHRLREIKIYRWGPDSL